MSGKAIFIAGPTGVGKTTTIKLLRERNPEFIYLPSYTTRPMRKGESNGNPYNFISKQDFEEKIKNKQMLEYALVHNAHYYGTPKDEIEKHINQDKLVYKEMEVQGYLQILKNWNNKFFISIFLYPKDPEIIKARILKRDPNMSTKDIRERLKSFDNEVKHINEFDYKVQTIEDGQEVIYEKVLDIFKKHT